MIANPLTKPLCPLELEHKLTTIMAPDANTIDQPDNGPASDTDARRSGDADRDSPRQTDAGDHDRSDDDDQETEQELGWKRCVTVMVTTSLAMAGTHSRESVGDLLPRHGIVSLVVTSSALPSIMANHDPCPKATYVLYKSIHSISCSLVSFSFSQT